MRAKPTQPPKRDLDLDVFDFLPPVMCRRRPKHEIKPLPDEGLTGEIKVGDTVETLNNKRAIIGPVAHINKRKVATVKGVEYEGGPEKTWTTHVENLRLIRRA